MKRSPLAIKKAILDVLREKDCSIRQLDIEARCGFKTALKQVQELEFLGIVQIEKIKRNPLTGRPSKIVKLKIHTQQHTKRKKAPQK